MRTSVAVLLVAAAALAETPKAKSVEKDGDRETVTLESGAVARVFVPKSIAKSARPGLVVTLHGMGDTPDTMLDWGKSVAEHRRDVWCAVQGGETVGSGFGWDPVKDIDRVVAMTRFALARYAIDPNRVVLQGFSAGGLTAMYTATQHKDLFAGWIACASRGWPGAPGTDPKGLRAILILGDRDNVFQAVEDIRKGIQKSGRGFSMWVVKGIGHVLPDAVYMNDALNAVLDPRAADGEKSLPARADHGLAPAAGPAGTGFRHLWIPFKAAGSAADVTRSRLQAKSIADGWLAKLKKGESTLEDLLAEADGGTAGGPAGLEGLAAFGKRAADRAKAAKAGAWELVEAERGFLILTRDPE